MSWASVVGAGIGLIGNQMSGGSQTTTQQIPPEFQGLASQVGQWGQGFANLPYTPYPYSRVADFNPYQYMGFDYLANQAMNSQLPAQAEQGLANQIGGVKNPYADAQTQVGTNPYAGANPYLENAISSTLGDVTKQFNTQVAPSMAATALKSGSFGNSGFQEAEANTRDLLAKRMGDISSGMRMQDYGMQQGLAESDINRRMQAQQGDLLRNTGAYENMFGRQMGALGMAPNIYNLGSLPGQQLQGIGSIMQQQGQNVLDANYGQFQEAQNWPFKIFDTMRSPFGGVNPGGTTTQTGSAGNPVAGALGGAMLGNKIGGYFGGQPTNYFGGSSYSGAGTPTDWWSGQGYY